MVPWVAAPEAVAPGKTAADVAESARDVLPHYEVTVLVVDPEGVARRFLELTLGRETGWQVESAKDAISALDILRVTPVDLIICERDLPDMSGLQFFMRLQEESRIRAVPFVFLSADTRVATRVLAFQAGADDFLTKPCDGAELVARAVCLVRKSRKAREALLTRQYVLAGDLSVMAFPDLVGTLEMQRRTGVLALTTKHAGAEVVFEEGRIVHAFYGSLAGPAAFFRLMGHSRGQFEFTPGPCELEPGERTITHSASWLIMEGARLLDTEKSLGGAPSLTPLPTVAPAPARPFDAVQLPPRTLATQFALGIGDAFALGQLRVHSYPELAQWTRAPGRHRLHVHLVCELSAGVSALLALAGPPTEREILAGLGTTEKALTLTFFLRGDRTLDLVLVDVARPAALQKYLLRPPSITLIAPAHGDYLSVGTRSRVELDGLLTRLTPQLVLGVGNSALRTHLAELSAIRAQDVPMFSSPGILGEGGADLRALLVQALRLWSPQGSGLRP